MTRNTMVHTLELDRDSALPFVKDIGKVLSSDSLKIEYSQIHGIFVYLPEYSFAITFNDFEKVMAIFEKDPWGPKLKAIRYRPTFDKDLYEATIKEAVNDYFPPFKTEED